MTGRAIAVAWALTGTAVASLGSIAWAFFSPSPHGYLELFIALPLIVVGLGTAGVALALGPFSQVLRNVGWAILATAVLPVVFALVVILSLALGFDW